MICKSSHPHFPSIDSNYSEFLIGLVCQHCFFFNTCIYLYGLRSVQFFENVDGYHLKFKQVMSELLNLLRIIVHDNMFERYE